VVPARAPERRAVVNVGWACEAIALEAYPVPGDAVCTRRKESSTLGSRPSPREIVEVHCRVISW
jgi:hypothetical protein